MNQKPSPTPSGARPPMPRLMFKLVNPLMKLALRSPLHARMSGRLMVLSFTGRKSGKRVSTPVGYVRDGEKILVFTHSAWRHNFVQPAPVTMRIQGKDVTGTALLVQDPARMKDIIQKMMRANGEEMGRRMGLWVENIDTLPAGQVAAATPGVYYIEIETGRP